MWCKSMRFLILPHFLADGSVHVYVASIPWVSRTETSKVAMNYWG